MKMLKRIIYSLAIVSVFYSCNEGIDPVSFVDPGADESSPVVTIVSPLEGHKIKVPDLIAPITINFEVTDDIEIGSISVKFDGAEIKNYSTFKDYRRAIDELVYENVENGAHIISITATDLEGKSTTAAVNLEKVSPYTKKYDGEVLYLPFDGDNMELISFQYPTAVGNMGFAGEGIKGDNALKGAADSYLTFPMEGMKSSEFSAAFWYKVNTDAGRAGILSVGAVAGSRKEGFRLFREGNTESQRLKLNVGIGSGESWNNGGIIDATTGEWVHVAITISETENVVYFNGAAVRTSTMTSGIDWTGCENITIAAGGETFSYWSHLSDPSYIDELRFFDKALSPSEIQTIIFDDSPYEVKYSGEMFYMPFESNNRELISNNEATMVGTTDFAEGKKGNAFWGATDSYLTYPMDGLTTAEFSATFWYKVDASADRAGILSVGSEAESRTEGLRLFREGNTESQRLKLNVGTGTGESWNDGGLIDVTAGEWVHVAFSISAEKNTIYFNGEEIRSSDMAAGIDWTGCTKLTIGAGGETFSYWSHLSDPSNIDELRLYNKALSQAEIQTIMNND